MVGRICNPSGLTLAGRLEIRPTSFCGRYLLHDCRGNVGAVWIHVHEPIPGDDDQVHILHRNGAEQDLLAHYQRTGKADPILEVQLHRADVGNELLAIRQGRFLLGDSSRPSWSCTCTGMQRCTEPESASASTSTGCRSGQRGFLSDSLALVSPIGVSC